MSKSKQPDLRKLLQKYQNTLRAISIMGDGLREEVKDWTNIGKNAVYTAKEALKVKCPRCGK